MTVRRTAGIFAIVMLLLALDAVPAGAHDPVFLSEEHTSPEVGPLLPDGTISFALYGRLLSPSVTQGFQAGMNDGDALNLSLLIPAVLPETSFEVGSLPTVSRALYQHSLSAVGRSSRGSATGLLQLLCFRS